MTTERLARLLRLAFARNDRLAITTLTARLRSIRWEPEPEPYVMFVGLRRAA